MNVKSLFWILACVLLFSIVGCQKQDTEPAADLQVAEETTNERRDRGGIDKTNELALGTLRLESTANAMTPEQAADMLPLWQIIEGGALKSTAETDAVLAQIEGKMSDAQLAAIKAMALTLEDVQTWMTDQGIDMRMPQGGGQGGSGTGPGTMQNLSEEERAKMRDEFQNMSAEERATRMAELGIQRPEGGQDGNGANPGIARGDGRFNPMLAPLIDLLTERTAH